MQVIDAAGKFNKLLITLLRYCRRHISAPMHKTNKVTENCSSAIAHNAVPVTAASCLFGPGLTALIRTARRNCALNIERTAVIAIPEIPAIPL
jgi:hypothetical protein